MHVKCSIFCTISSAPVLIHFIVVLIGDRTYSAVVLTELRSLFNCACTGTLEGSGSSCDILFWLENSLESLSAPKSAVQGVALTTLMLTSLWWLPGFMLLC